MALIAEAAELVEHFQWLTEEQSANLPPEKLGEVELELADIQIYLVEEKYTEYKCAEGLGEGGRNSALLQH